MALALALAPAFAFALTTRAFPGFAGKDIAHGFDGGVAFAFTACAFTGLTGERSGRGAGANCEDGSSHGNFVEFDHDKSPE